MQVLNQKTGKRIRIDPSQSKGKGGEADVFLIGPNEVAKIFKPPSHPDFDGLPLEQEGARQRIQEHQKKLPAFPSGLPDKVITPHDILLGSDKRICGYTMPFLDDAEVLFRYGDRKFRESGILIEDVINIFLGLHPTIEGVHKAKVIMGDFNDLNVLVAQNVAYVIDADSFQFGSFKCKVFTAQFVDPLLCDPKAKRPMLAKPHTEDSDWYAFNIMLMKALLYASPYDGVYRPKKGHKVKHDARPLHRITVFNPEVRYPKPAIPYGVLPDELLDHFQKVFEKDQRGPFPIALLQNLRWTSCTACGTEHARANCPECAQASPLAVRETTVVRGQVTATRVFQVKKGIILHSAVQNGKASWLYHENDEFRREDGTKTMSGKLDPQMRFRFQGRSTVVAKKGRMIKLIPDEQPKQYTVGNFGQLPMIDANSRYCYWIEADQLKRDDIHGEKVIGNILANQTLFWIGETFGFGFYRAGTLNVAFVFDAERTGINDNVKISPIRGQLVDATCVFSHDRAWFLVASQEAGKTVNQCMVIRKDGTVEATARDEDGDIDWLSKIRGNCAAGNFLLVSTDDGIKRIQPENGQLVVAQEFPDTEPFVDSETSLFATNQGLYAVRRKEINLLKIR